MSVMATKSEKFGICLFHFSFNGIAALQMEKSSPITSCSESEYDEKT